MKRGGGATVEKRLDAVRIVGKDGNEKRGVAKLPVVWLIDERARLAEQTADARVAASACEVQRRVASIDGPVCERAELEQELDNLEEAMLAREAHWCSASFGNNVGAGAVAKKRARAVGAATRTARDDESRTAERIDYIGRGTALEQALDREGIVHANGVEEESLLEPVNLDEFIETHRSDGGHGTCDGVVVA